MRYYNLRVWVTVDVFEIYSGSDNTNFWQDIDYCEFMEKVNFEILLYTGVFYISIYFPTLYKLFHEYFFGKFKIKFENSKLL